MSKNAILGAIRRGVRRGPLPPDQTAVSHDRLQRHPRRLIPARHLIPARRRVTRPQQVAPFVRNVEQGFGTVARVPDPARVPDAVAEVADDPAAQDRPGAFAIAPYPEPQTLPWDRRPLSRLRRGRAVASDPACVQHAHTAVAETGTLVLPSAPERPTTLDPRADAEIVVVPRATCSVGAGEDARNLPRAERPAPATRPVSGSFMPRGVLLVTGPSRSADIEPTLERGAPGPRRLHVVLIEDDPAALTPEGHA